jgi:hypothetical protein
MSATARRSISLGCPRVASQHAATAAELRASEIFLEAPPDASNESRFRGSNRPENAKGEPGARLSLEHSDTTPAHRAGCAASSSAPRGSSPPGALPRLRKRRAGMGAHRAASFPFW